MKCYKIIHPRICTWAWIILVILSKEKNSYWEETCCGTPMQRKSVFINTLHSSLIFCLLLLISPVFSPHLFHPVLFFLFSALRQNLNMVDSKAREFEVETNLKWMNKYHECIVEQCACVYKDSIIECEVFQMMNYFWVENLSTIYICSLNSYGMGFGI